MIHVWLSQSLEAPWRPSSHFAPHPLYGPGETDFPPPKFITTNFLNHKKQEIAKYLKSHLGFDKL